MKHFSIGVISDSFRLGLREGIRKAAQVGAQGVQIYAVSGEMAPDNLSKSARRELRDFIADLGLAVSALCGDPGGHGFAVAQDNPERIELSKKILDLALDLGTKVVTTHIGVVPTDGPSHPRWGVMADACDQLGRYADSVGAYFAVETGPEPAERLRRFLDGLGSRGVRVNFDPANLHMVIGEDIPAAVRTLAPYIVHTHAKDGDRYKACDPERIYRMFAQDGIEGIQVHDYFMEKPLGKGQIDWPAYLSALREIGYTGYLTIEREVGPDPETDIREAVAFLQGLID
ncbi:MAG: sugar phosphate isomerase/epimerase family protein [Christensenellales bacterium]|jgi:L-ribulose-5-phosphate 3-epimerase